jgi:3-oxoacyl-[acyl-carrier-protein] synthase II
MSRRRVVVTGLGCVSPVGNTVAEAWSNVLAGKSGIGAITKFDSTLFSCKIAGEVRGLDLEQYISTKESLPLCKQWPIPGCVPVTHWVTKKQRASAA